MKLDELQRQAELTDQRPSGAGPNRSEDALVIPLLGISGELGTLHSAYKKYLRDGDQYRPFKEDVAEELGDILWYLSNLATKFGLSLDDIARENALKLQDRWGALAQGRHESDLLDATSPADQQLPREFEIEFRPAAASDRPEDVVEFLWNGKPWGDALANNAYTDDGYRFHDAFHLAHAAILGWSPVCRREKQFNCKRGDDRMVDAVEDGGRAIVIEEALVAYVYGHARDHGWFENLDSIDFAILKTIKGLTQGLEVQRRPAREWEYAILEGYRVWRELWVNNGGVVYGNQLELKLEYRPLR